MQSIDVKSVAALCKKMFMTLGPGRPLFNLFATFRCSLNKPNTFKNGPSRPLFRLFLVFFKRTALQFLQQINVKNVHPVYRAAI